MCVVLLFLQGVPCLAGTGCTACGPGPGPQALLLPVLELMSPQHLQASGSRLINDVEDKDTTVLAFMRMGPVN